MAKASETHVALLRGINVGGKNKLPMAQLAEIFAAAGCEDVRTYIQSGNVVFRATPAVVAKVPAQVTAGIAKRVGLRVPVVLRSARELAAIAKANPFDAAATAAGAVHVLFLADRPSRAQLAGLDPDRSPPDTFVAQGREIYLCCPNGVARTKLTNAYFDTKLGTVSTLRNWRTLEQLIAMSTSES